MKSNTNKCTQKILKSLNYAPSFKPAQISNLTRTIQDSNHHVFSNVESFIREIILHATEDKNKPYLNKNFKTSSLFKELSNSYDNSLIEDILNSAGIKINELNTAEDLEIFAKKIMTTSALLDLTQKQTSKASHLPLSDPKVTPSKLLKRISALNERPLCKSLVASSYGEKNSHIDSKIAFFFLNLSSRAIDNNLTTSEIANLPKQVLKLDAFNINEAEKKLNLKLRPSKVKKIKAKDIVIPVLDL